MLYSWDNFLIMAGTAAAESRSRVTVATRWDEKAGLRRDAVRSQVIDALEAQEIKETGSHSCPN